MSTQVEVQNELDLTLIQLGLDKGAGFFNDGTQTIPFGLGIDADAILNMASHALGKGLALAAAQNVPSVLPEEFKQKVEQVQMALILSNVIAEAKRIAAYPRRRFDDPIPPL